MHDARTFVVYSHECLCVCGCVSVWKGCCDAFHPPCGCARRNVLNTHQISILSAMNTHTHMHGMPTYTHVYRVCERAREMRGEQVSRRETTLCAARFDFGAAVRRRQPIAKLQPADWTNSSGPNGPQMDSGCPRTQGKRYRWTENKKKKQKQKQKQNQRHVPKSVEWIALSCWKMWKIT